MGWDILVGQPLVAVRECQQRSSAAPPHRPGHARVGLQPEEHRFATLRRQSGGVPGRRQNHEDHQSGEKKQVHLAAPEAGQGLD